MRRDPLPRAGAHGSCPGWPPRLFRLSSVLLALAAALPAPAQAGEWEVALRHGQHGGDYEATALDLRLGPWWTSDWGHWDLSVRPAFEVSHFRQTHFSPGPDALNLFGASGVFRIQRREGFLQPYAEAGLGAAWLSRESLGPRQLSTHFQFSERLGLGLAFGGNWFAGWQYTHYSNGGIKEPNNGVDVHQLVIGARLRY